jgi:hypothetical protein
MLNHLSEHLSLWYADATLLAANVVLQKTFADPRITLEALQTVKGLESELDRLIAELTPDVLSHAQETLAPVMEVIQKAQALIKQLAPPPPMDPSAVAAQDVQRQTNKDQGDLALKGQEVQQRDAAQQRELAAKSQDQQRKDALAAQAQQDKTELERQRLQQQQEDQERKDTLTAAGLHVQDRRNDVTLQTSQGNNQTTLETNRATNETTHETTKMDNETAIDIADKKIEEGKGAGNISDGAGLK